LAARQTRPNVGAARIGARCVLWYNGFKNQIKEEPGMKVLVSACLLGMACRYDGRSKQNEEVIGLQKKHTLIPFCPEIYGGLPTPREPSEIREGRVYAKSGTDVTPQFEKGAAEALRLCRTLGCECALLQDKSPSCGCGWVHDGNFADGLVEGDGLTTKRLKMNGVRVVPASRAGEIADRAECPCTTKCHRHGDCDACRAHHAGRRKPPFCDRG